MQRCTLFLIPFSGGHRFSFEPLVRVLPDWIRAVALELPGHGARYREPLLRDVDAMAEDIDRQIGAVEPPYALFGHSLGGRLAFAVALRLQRRGAPLPRALFASGASAPGVPLDKIRHALPERDFIEELRKLGGAPPELYDNAELRDLFMPVLRADFEAAETYDPGSPEPLRVPIHVLAGNDEPVSEEGRAAWQPLSTERGGTWRFPGGHFFIFSEAAAVAERVASVLEGATRD